MTLEQLVSGLYCPFTGEQVVFERKEAKPVAAVTESRSDYYKSWYKENKSKFKKKYLANRKTILANYHNTKHEHKN